MTSTHLAAFVKYARQQAGLTQEQLAQKAGVGLRFIRDLEQGKESLRLDKVNQLLSLFGYQMRAEKGSVDPYEIWMNYLNKGVVIILKDRKKLFGILIDEIKDTNHKIIGWEFIPNNQAIEFQKTQDPKLKTKIKQEDILEIELQ
jgi:y4mF family transcriptional regulator